MSDNCFIDTNILVYCYTNDEPVKQQKALDIANNPDLQNGQVIQNSLTIINPFK